MKHIKKYKVFEKVDIDDMKKSCEEILFDMEDCKYTVNVKNYLDKDINRFLGYTSINDRINIIIKLPEFDNLEQLYNFYIDTKEVRDETILRLLDYMKQKKWRCIFNSYDFNDGLIKNAHTHKYHDDLLLNVYYIDIRFKNR
jgi:hypothetical protein